AAGEAYRPDVSVTAKRVGGAFVLRLDELRLQKVDPRRDVDQPELPGTLRRLGQHRRELVALLGPWTQRQAHAREQALRPGSDRSRSHAPAEPDRGLEVADRVPLPVAQPGELAEQQRPRPQGLAAVDDPQLAPLRDAFVEHRRVLAIAQRDAERGEPR